MQQQLIQLLEIRLVGITRRTNNKAEMDPSTAQIGATIEQYFQQGVSDKIINRNKPGITYCAYTDYENDITGDYTYFIGEAVGSFQDQPEELSSITVPAGSYTKFTTGPGLMPKVCIDLWKKIWAMTSNDFGGKRNYRTDFELYDERAQDPSSTTLDICIGIN